MFGRPTEIPTVAQALPGRDQAMRFDPVHLVLGTSMVEPFPEDCDQIVLGLGCFWGAERLFWNLPGVHTTAVGYAAGHTPNPTYQEVCTGMTGHNEVVLVVYRRQQIRSGIYYHDDAQRVIAEQSMQRYRQKLEAAGFAPITTEILPAGPFYYAEDYHQQYLEKNPAGYCGLRGTGVSC
jgi:peptide-methionine (S)-S-oxide reductase